MKKTLIAGFATACLAITVFSHVAHASDDGERYIKKHVTKTHAHNVKYQRALHRSTARKSTVATPSHRNGQMAMPSDGTRARVVSLIQANAPAYGVPTWFALRIAKVESNYNPSVRGSAGEYGVYQLKCATARGVGFSGNCSQLLNPAVNVRYGLKHLATALRMSNGNLQLAASKHNGGLGTKRVVRRYVQLVF